MKIIIHIQDRGHQYLYHWFLLMIAGLRKFNREDLINHVRNMHPDRTITEEIFICFPYMENQLLDFHLETLDLIKDKYKIIETKDISPSEDFIVDSYGEEINLHSGTNNLDIESYYFLRNLLFPQNMKELGLKKNKIYIRRNKSHKLAANNGLKRRQIINEDFICERFANNGYLILNLEDINLSEKINIFSNNSLVISPNSAGLLFAIFSTNTTIVEINVKNPSQTYNQYLELSDALKHKYFRFYAEKVDENDNMMLDTDSFFSFLSENKIDFF